MPRLIAPPTPEQIRRAINTTGYRYDESDVLKTSRHLSSPKTIVPDKFPDNWGLKLTWRDKQVLPIPKLPVRAAAASGAVPVNLRDWAHTASYRGWGSGWPSCTGVSLFGGTLIVTGPRSGARWSWNRRLATLVAILTAETERRGFLMKPGQCGAYNCRAIANTKTPSNHSWAIAGDLNWTDNPFTTSGKHTIPQWVYDLWARYGFANGSMYTGAKDWMHLEFMGSPAQCDAMTALAIFEIQGGPAVPIIPTDGSITWIMEAAMPFPSTLYKGDGIKGAKNNRGSLHWYVMTLQAALNVRGLTARAPVNGQFDAATDTVVRELQTKHKLVVDGVVGPATLAWVLGNDAPDYV